MRFGYEVWVRGTGYEAWVRGMTFGYQVYGFGMRFRAGGSKIKVARPCQQPKCCLINYSWGIRVIRHFLLHFKTFGCNTECSNFRINCKCNRPQASCKLAEVPSEHTWHLNVHWFALVLQTFINQSHSCFNYSWCWPKSGPAMAWLAGSLPPALRLDMNCDTTSDNFWCTEQ